MRYRVLLLSGIYFSQLLIGCSNEKRSYGSDFGAVRRLFKAESLFEKHDYLYWEDIPLSNPRSVGPTDSRMIIVIKPKVSSVRYLKRNLKGNCLSFVDTSYIREWMPTSILKILTGQDSCCYINTAEILYNTHKSSAILTKDDYLMFIID